MPKKLARAVAAVLALCIAALLSPPSVDANAATTPSCGGETVYKSVFRQWVCTFDDEFDGASLDTSKWIVQTTAATGYHNGPECFVNSSNNVSVSGGTLNLTVRKEAAPFTCASPAGNYTTQYTSGEVSTWGLFSQTYGRFEIRAKFPAATVAGLQESLWLWPQNPNTYGAWPRSGEIDVAEAFSQYPDRAIPYVHYVPKGTDSNSTNTNCMISNLNAFHTYVVVWTSTRIVISYDGNVCLSDAWEPAPPLRKPEPFDQPFIIALTQALGVGSNSFDAAATPLPATTSIDYVRVWR